MVDLTSIDIPRKVIEYMDDDGKIDGRRIIRTIYDCPNCGKSYLIFGEDRCPRCEQKLKW